MNKTVLVWMGIAALLSARSFVRPSYAVGFYMLSFFAAPAFWWWGDVIEGYRWNFYAGILLFGTLLWRGQWGSDRALLLRLPRLVLAAAVMAVATRFAAGWLSPWLMPETGLLHQISALLGLIAAAMVVYFGLAFAIGGTDIQMIRRNVRRGKEG